MSNKTSIIAPQHHDSMEELIKKEKIKREKERQKVIFKDIIIPYLKANTKSMHEAGELMAKTKLAVEEVYKEMVMNEQGRISSSKIEDIGVDERLEKAKLTRERSLVALLKDEPLGKVCAILDAFAGWTGISREAEDKKRTIDSFPFSNLV